MDRADGPPGTVSCSLVKVFPSGETVSLPELSGRFGPFKRACIGMGRGGHLYRAHLFALRILHVRFAAIQLDGVGHADEIDVVNGNGERECQLIAGLRDLQRERFGIAFLAVHFLASRRQVPISGSGAAKAAEVTITTAAERSSDRFTSSSS